MAEKKYIPEKGKADFLLEHEAENLVEAYLKNDVRYRDYDVWSKTPKELLVDFMMSLTWEDHQRCLVCGAEWVDDDEGEE